MGGKMSVAMVQRSFMYLVCAGEHCRFRHMEWRHWDLPPVSLLDPVPNNQFVLQMLRVMSRVFWVIKQNTFNLNIVFPDAFYPPLKHVLRC